MVEAFLDYVDGGRQVGLDPALVRSDSFRALLRGLVDAIAQGRVRAGAHGLRVVRLQGRVRAHARCSSGGGSSRSAIARIQQVLRLQGRRRDVPPGGRRTRASAPAAITARASSSKRARARARRRSSWTASSDRALGGGPAGRDRGRHLHRERRHHDEAAPARAAGAGAVGRGRARRRSGASGRGPGSARARPGLHHPRALRRAPGRAAAGVRRASGLPRRRRRGDGHPLRRGLGGVARPSASWPATRPSWRRWTPGSRWRRTAGASAPRCAAWPAPSSTSATSGRWSRRAPSIPAAWRRDLQAQAARGPRPADACPRRRRAGRRAWARWWSSRPRRIALRGRAPWPRTCGPHAPIVPAQLRRTRRTGPRRKRSRRRARIVAWTSQALAAWKAASSAALHARLVNAAARGGGRLRGAQEGTRRPRLPRPPGQGARRPPRQRGGAPLLPRALPGRDHRRVPGHRPPAGRGGGAPHRRIARARWSWSATPSSRSTASGAPRSRSSARVAADAAARPGHAVLHLTQNFRSRAAILRFVNRVFAALITASDEAGQPAYEADRARRPGSATSPPSSRCASTRRSPRGRTCCARRRARSPPSWPRWRAGAHEVRDPATGVDAAEPRRRRHGPGPPADARCARWRRRLESAGLRFTIEGGKSFFDRQEVHEVLAVLRALDDPSDRVSPRGRAPLVLLRRERPGHRGLRAVRGRARGLGAGRDDASRPGRRRDGGAGARAAARPCTACARRSPSPP